MMRLVRLELFKIFSQKVIYIAFVFFAGLYGFHFFSQLEKESDILAKRAAYEQFGGQLTGEKIAWAEQVRSEYDKRLSEGKEAGHKPPIIDPELYGKSAVAFEILNILERQRYYNSHLHWLEEKIQASQPSSYTQKMWLKELAMKEEIGSPDYIINQRGWLNILRFMNEIGYFFVASLAIIGLSGIFSREYTSRMDSLIFSSRHGRKRAVWVKIAAAAIYCLVVVLAFTLYVLALNSSYYGITGWQADLVNLHNLYADTSFGGPIWSFYLLQTLLAVLGCLTLGTLVMYISTRTRRSIIPVFIGGMVFMLPIVTELLQIHFIAAILNQLFFYTAFIKLELLDRYYFINLLGTPIWYGNVLPLIMLACISITTVLMLISIKRRQVM